MVSALLLDADGVLQRVGGDGWRARIAAELGERTDEGVASLRAMEDPALAAEHWHHDLGTDVLREHLGRYGVLARRPAS